MDTLLWGLVAMGISWLPVGYLLSRFINSSGLGHSLSRHDFLGPNYCGSSICNCPKSETSWNWNRAITSEGGSVWFAVGVLLGWAGFALFLYVTIAVLLMFYTSKLLHFVGRVITPKATK